MKETEQDKAIICCNCGEEFIFSVGEQEFYQERNFIPPRRCPFCRREIRRKRKALEGEQVRKVSHEG